MKKRILFVMSCLFAAAPAVFGEVTTMGEQRALSATSGSARECSLMEASNRDGAAPASQNNRERSTEATPATTAAAAL